MPLTIDIVRPGHIFDKAVVAEKFYGMDWTDWLPTGAQVSASTWTIVEVAWTVPEGEDDSAGEWVAVEDGDDALTKDNEGVDEATERIAILRLLAGTAGTVYRVTSTVTTDEAIPQTDARFFYARVY